MNITMRFQRQLSTTCFTKDVSSRGFKVSYNRRYFLKTLHLECTETTFLPGVRIGEDKRGAHRLTQLYFAKTVNKFS
jgi:hypothetical protein